MELKNIEQILEELYSYSKFGIKLGLENIRKLMKALGNPQDEYKIIHIAGTNGKGSTASMIEASLVEAGYRVGKYTSPHILKFNERIVLNEEEISDEEIVQKFLKVKETIKEEGLTPTFFEVTTAMMFLYFKEQKIDYLVLEVGLGGRYDATNIVNPVVSVITSISMDHINLLGNTIYEIAREKAGIIKKAPVFLSYRKEEVLKAVEEMTNNYIIASEEYPYQIFLEDDMTIVKISNEYFKISLYGKFQGENFLTAYSVLKYLKIKDVHIKNGVKKINWPGRYEKISREGHEIILDGAHNEGAALKLKENIESKYKKSEITLICSILEDKEREKIINIFSSFSGKIIYTGLKEFMRGTSGEEIYKIDKISKEKSFEENISKAYEKAKKNKIIVVAGSFYLISKFKKEILI